MEVNQEKKRPRGRPKKSRSENIKKTNCLPTNTATPSKIMNKNASCIAMCSDSSNSFEKSLVKVALPLDAVATDNSESTCIMQSKVSDTRSINLKEARVFLPNIFHSTLISPKQRTELLNKRYNLVHSKPPSVLKKEKQRKKKSKPRSIPSTTSGSSIIYLGKSTPIVTNRKNDLMLTLKKIKVEPLQKTPEIQSYNNGPPLSQNKLQRGSLNISKASTDTLNSIHGSSSFEQLESKKPKKVSRGVKRKRSKSSFEDGSFLDESLPKRRSDIKQLAKGRRKDSCDVKNKRIKLINGQNSRNKGSKKTPKKNDSPKTPLKNVLAILQTEKSPPLPNITFNHNIDHRYRLGVDVLGNRNHSIAPPILSPIIFRLPLVYNNRAQVEIPVNDQTPSAVCISRTEVEIRPDYKLPQTSFTPSETEVELDLDEKHSSLDSIVQAIENDLAAGNRLSPLGDIENIGIPADLATDARKMVINGSATADHSENLQQVKEKARNVSERGSDSRETSSNNSSWTATPESDRKRKCPVIVKDQILPNDAISVSPRNGTKKHRTSNSTVVSETTMTSQKINHNLNANGNNADYIFIKQTDVSLPSSLHSWMKCSAIEPLPEENTANDRLSNKHGCIIDDALNNNQEINVANKNTLSSKKQEENITLYAPAATGSPGFEEEYDALRGLLTDLADGNNHNSKIEVDGCPGLDNILPNPITEVDDCPNLANKVSSSISKVDDCPDVSNNVPNSISEVDDCLHPANNIPSVVIEVDTNLELGDTDREVDEAIASWEALVKSSRMKKNSTEKENSNLASLTLDNVEKFDCAANGSTTVAEIASPTQFFGTESSKRGQSKDITEYSSINERRRRWIPSEDINSSTQRRRKVRLNRGNWITGRTAQTECSSASRDSSAQFNSCFVTNENVAQESNKNDKKIVHSHKGFAETVTNNTSQKPSYSAKDVQNRDNIIHKAVLGFGEGVSDRKSQTDGYFADSSGSSISSPSSDSSSSSSSSSNSESSDDKIATEKFIENVTERNPENTTEKVYENFCQPISKSIAKNNPRNLSSKAKKTGTTGASVSSIKSRGIESTKKGKAQLVFDKVEKNVEAAGGLIDYNLTDDQKDEDQEDCISLFADSTIMSRCDSPPLNEPPKQIRSPLYKQMKSSNIDSFVNANKQQCDADIANYKETVNNDANNKKQQQIKKEQKKAKEPRPNINSMPSLDPTNEIQIRPTVQTGNKPNPPRSMLDTRFEQDPKYFFYGQCYTWLRLGKCNQSSCRYSHVLKPEFQRINGYEMKIIDGILRYAVSNRYCFFIGVVHNQLVESMSTEQIICLYQCLYMNQLLMDMTIVSTIDALLQRGMYLKDIVTTLNNMIVGNDPNTPYGIIRAVIPKIKESGTLWETLAQVIAKASPTVELVEILIEECINKNKGHEHLYDVNEKLIKNLPANFLRSIRFDLMMRFHDYLKKSDSLNGNVVNIVEAQDEPQQKSAVASSIASPDSVDQSLRHGLVQQLADVAKSMTNLTSTAQVKKTTTASGSASQRSSIDSQASGYSLEPIENLPSPKSPYREVLWKFHWDLQGVQEGLKHRDYTHVISILTQHIQHPSRLPHMKGFYTILCNEIMSSKQHLAEIVRLTVQPGASNDLRQFVFDLGVHVLTKLADIGAWVLAHELLKTFQVYGTYNTCAYTLLAVEIYIANYRPLKALELLKQSQLIFMNTKFWNQMRCPNDEPLRVTAMELLLSSFCEGHAQHALSLLEFILGDQCSNFKPINVSRYVDKIARALLVEKHMSSIIDFGRIVIQANLSLRQSTLRALINSIFHNDRVLARQLHRYATLLGVYSTAKISRTTHIVINNDWTEEEMFLMFSSLIKDLSTNIGHAIGRLRPRQLAVFLILETIPKEKDLCLDICNGPTTTTAINKRKAIVRNVLEHFDPKIKLVQKSQGRLCKVQSTSLVDYLKAGHFEH